MTRREESRLLDVIVLAGGPGAEREVSLSSGRAVFEALERLGHNASIHDIGPENLSALDRKADFVFLALHGEFGEDGQIQRILDERRLSYCGSGAAASRLAMNKAASKRRFEEVGVPTPEYRLLSSNSGNNFDQLRDFAIPAVVKPVSSGSSVDTTIVRTVDALRSACRDVVAKYGQALVERYIRGPELTVGVLGDEALPVCQIRTRREFYDYHAKYLADDTEYIFDPDLPSTLISRVQRLAVAAHGALGCEVFSRVDVLLDAETLDPFVIEVNTIPGFTGHSLLPKAAARVGLDFDRLCQTIIELSLARPRWASPP